MFQKSEIGKYRSIKSQNDAMLNYTCVTPLGDKYRLIETGKERNKTFYRYEWINCPESILAVTNNKLYSLKRLSLSDIMQWINDLKTIKQ